MKILKWIHIFKNLVIFWFNSQSGVLQRLVLWVITNMISSNSKKVIDFFLFDIDILNIIMTQFIDHDDILVQREATIALYHTTY